MRFDTAALVALLLLSGDAAVSNHSACAFVPSDTRTRAIVSLAVETSSSSELLPKRREQPQGTQFRGPVRRYRNYEKRRSFRMPEVVPKLSDILKSATLQDFSYNHVVADTPKDEQYEEEKKEITNNAKAVPKLSDLLKSATLQDFKGDIEPSSEKQNVHSDGGNNSSKNYPPTVLSRPEKLNKNGTGLRKRHKKRNSQPPVPPGAEPWKANYAMSLHTQGRIKAAARSNSSPTARAIAVLSTLLNTMPERCNQSNVICALTLSAKVLGASPIEHHLQERLQSLLLQTLDVLHDMVVNEKGLLKARQLCNAVWAIAKHYNRDSTLLPPPPTTTAMSTDEVLGVAETWVLQNETKQCAEKRVSETVDAVARQLVEILTDDREQERAKSRPKVGEIAMASWAYGVLRPRRLPPGWTMPRQMGRVMPQTPVGGVEYITFEQWSRGESDNEGDFELSSDVTDQLFDAIGETLCKDQTHATSSKEAGVKDDELSSSNLENRNGNNLVSTLSWNEIANVAWAYATHGHCRTPWSERVMVALAQDATRRLSKGTERMLPRDVAQLVWSLGTLQSDNFRLGDSLVGLVDAIANFYLNTNKSEETNSFSFRPLRDWFCPDLVQLAISMAHGRIDHFPMLNALYEEAHARLRTPSTSKGPKRNQRYVFCTWELGVLLWAQARLYLRSEQGDAFDDFTKAATNRLVRSLQNADMSLRKIGIGSQEQANIAWSLAVLEQYDSPEAGILIPAIFQEAADSSESCRVIQLEHAHQLFQSLCLLEEARPQLVSYVPKWFRDFLQEKWTVEKSRQKTSSARHRALSQTLSLMGVAHYNEHDEDIDLAIVLKDEASWTGTARRADHHKAQFKVAVEFDGPHHFTREWKPEMEKTASSIQQPRALGHTVLKYRLLKQQGWTVVRVPYYEFDKIPFWASMERQRYLQRLLKTHANINFSSVDVSEYKAMVPNRGSRFD